MPKWKKVNCVNQWAAEKIIHFFVKGLISYILYHFHIPDMTFSGESVVETEYELHIPGMGKGITDVYDVKRKICFEVQTESDPEEEKRKKKYLDSDQVVAMRIIRTDELPKECTDAILKLYNTLKEEVEKSP
ncbi:TPA_asm: hypothetical protein vir519_00046 [Caudoviricetes sp. vir519]|nr:TPA_asm: hypothetical protein vir519_00046 [Caudoviricetes sp. vir519]